MSRPTRGAWIETSKLLITEGIKRRAPRGARGLKRPGNSGEHGHKGRAPRGARGLKLPGAMHCEIVDDVAPHAGRVD